MPQSLTLSTSCVHQLASVTAVYNRSGILTSINSMLFSTISDRSLPEWTLDPQFAARVTYAPASCTIAFIRLTIFSSEYYQPLISTHSATQKDGRLSWPEHHKSK